jgi:Co/Zn/Cd efflux system component
MEHDHGKKIGWTVLLNLVITLAEYIGGTMSGSLALQAVAS